jgi:hypothetical protein
MVVCFVGVKLNMTLNGPFTGMGPFAVSSHFPDMG